MTHIVAKVFESCVMKDSSEMTVLLRRCIERIRRRSVHQGEYESITILEGKRIHTSVAAVSAAVNT